MIVTLEGEVLVEVDLTGVLADLTKEVEIEAVTEEDSAVETVEEIDVPVLTGMICIRQYAINAVRTVKFLA